MGMNTAALTLGQASVWRAAAWVPRMRSHGFACGRYKDYLTPTSNALWYCRAWKVWATWYLSVYLLLKSIRRRRTQDRFSMIFGFTFSTLSYNGTPDPLGNGTMPTLSPRVSERCRITSYRKKTFSYLKSIGERDFFFPETLHSSYHALKKITEILHVLYLILKEKEKKTLVV